MNDARLSPPLGEDGLFKLLTWNSLTLTRIFGLPDIEGAPIEQEFQFPASRRVDRLYRLEDRSLLNIEHQSSLKDREALARRMAVYRIMIRERFPDARLRQVVVYTGREPQDRSRLGATLDYEDHDGGGGLAFCAPLRDLRALPASEFLRSGRIDDLILGLMAARGEDEAYVREVVARVRAAVGEERRRAREKYLAVCATMGNREALRQVEDLTMWLEDMKDSPFIQQIVEIAGRARIEAASAEGEAKGLAEGEAKGLAEGRRRGLARSLVRYALRHDVRLPAAPELVEARLAARADDAKLEELLDDLDALIDFDAYLRAHGIAIGDSPTG
jgi:hypothetical protein